MTGNGDEPRPRFDTATGRRIVGYDPYTGEPILGAPSGGLPGGNPQWFVALQERYRGLSSRAQVLVIVGAIGVALVIVVIVAGVSGSSSKQGWLPEGAVAGSFQGDLPASVQARHVYCEWQDGHVEVHVDFHYQGYGEQTQNTIYLPKYVIDGQTHGDSAGAEVIHLLNPGWNSETDDAGTPDNTPNNEPIQSCIPG
jgi:hypothetical protein